MKGMCFCKEEPCQKMIKEEMARLNNGFITTYIDMLEPREILDFDMMSDPKLGDEAAQKLKDGWTAERNHNHTGWILYPPKHEPSDFQEWEDQYHDGRQYPPLWMVIAMAVGSVLMAYGAMLAAAYLLT